MMRSPKLGRVRSGSRRYRDPSGLWLRLAVGSIAIHGVVVVLLLTVTDRASEARHALTRRSGVNQDAIAIDVIAVSDRATPVSPKGVLQSAALTTMTAPPSSSIQTRETRETRNPSTFVDRVENTATSNPTSSPTLTPTSNPVSATTPNPARSPAPTPAATPTVSPSPVPSPVPSPATQPVATPSPTPRPDNPSPTTGGGSGNGENSGHSTGDNTGNNNSGGTNTGNGEDTNTSNGRDRFGLTIRLTPLVNETSAPNDPDRRPAQLTAPAANLNIPANADPALLPPDLTPPLEIGLQVELSIDPTGIPSLVRILEPNGDRELSQFEPFVTALIEDWRFDPAVSLANGHEVDQLDLVLVLQWR